MSTPIKKSIKDNVVAALKTITTANGYEQDVASDLVFSRAPQRPNEVSSYPALWAFWEAEIGNNELLQSMTVKHAILTVGAWVGRVDDAEDALEKLACDVEKVLMVSRTRGGYALDTAFRDIDVMWHPEGMEPRGMAYLSFEIRYRHPVGNPY